MFNEYENYMRSVLGYPNYQQEVSNTYFPYRNGNDFVDESRYENMYPEIYRILKPMIKKICDSRSYDEITEDLLDNMTDEIYRNIESEIDVVNLNITTENEYNKSNNQVRSGNTKMTIDNKENETRACCSNPMLKDLIKILLLNQIINNKPPRPNRPRPPFSPQYGPWQGRPPYRNNIEDPYLGNIY